MQLSKQHIGLGHWVSWLVNVVMTAPACAFAFYLADQAPDGITPEALVLALCALATLNFLLVCLLDNWRRRLNFFTFPALLSTMGALLLATTATALQKALHGLVEISWAVPFVLLATCVNVLAAFLERRFDLKVLFCVNINILALLAAFCLSDRLRLPL